MTWYSSRHQCFRRSKAELLLPPTTNSFYSLTERAQALLNISHSPYCYTSLWLANSFCFFLFPESLCLNFEISLYVSQPVPPPMWPLTPPLPRVLPAARCPCDSGPTRPWLTPRTHGSLSHLRSVYLAEIQYASKHQSNRQSLS